MHMHEGPSLRNPRQVVAPRLLAPGEATRAYIQTAQNDTNGPFPLINKK